MSIVLQDIFGREYPLDKPLTIGSDSSNRLILLDSSISPFHAEISLAGGRIQVIDQDSDYGAFINGERIVEKQAAGVGDKISIGKVEFLVVGEEPDQSIEEIREKIGLITIDPDLIPVEESLPEKEVQHLPDLQPEPVVEIPEETTSEEQIFSIKSPGYVEMREELLQPYPPAGEIPDTRLDMVLPVGSSSTITNPVPPDAGVTQGKRKQINVKLILAIGGVLVILAAVMGIFSLVSFLGGQKTAPAGGMDVLDLTDKALNTVYTASFIQHQEDTYEGVDANGAALKVKVVQENMEQSTPKWSNYIRYQLTSNMSIQKDTEFSIINGQVYSRAKNACSVFPDPTAGSHKPTDWPRSFLKSYITGTARKVESNVKVNGVLTDKYELKLENSPFATSLIKMDSGELYRARKGGFLVKLVISQTWDGEKWQGASTYGFAGSQPIKIKNEVDFTYYPTGKLNVIVPGVCAGKLNPAQ
jgi:hypothetical protein